MTASKSVLAGQEFFRVTQEVTTNGFGIDFDVSIKSISVGPDSDFDEYGVFYFDPADDLAVKLATISPGRPFTGRLDSLNDSPGKSLVKATSAGVDLKRTARIVVVPESIFDLGFFTVFGASLRARKFPRVDLIGSFSESVQVQQCRSDFRFSFSLDIAAGAGGAEYAIPVYGRRSFSINLRSLGVAAGLQTMGVNGLRDTADGQTNQVEIFTPTDVFLAALPNGGTPSLLFHYESTTSGAFDYIIIEFVMQAGYLGSDPSAAGLPQNIIFTASDSPGG